MRCFGLTWDVEKLTGRRKYQKCTYIWTYISYAYYNNNNNLINYATAQTLQVFSLAIPWRASRAALIATNHSWGVVSLAQGQHKVVELPRNFPGDIPGSRARALSLVCTLFCFCYPLSPQIPVPKHRLYNLLVSKATQLYPPRAPRYHFPILPAFPPPYLSVPIPPRLDCCLHRCYPVDLPAQLA